MKETWSPPTIPDLATTILEPFEVPLSYDREVSTITSDLNLSVTLFGSAVAHATDCLLTPEIVWEAA